MKTFVCALCALFLLPCAAAAQDDGPLILAARPVKIAINFAKAREAARVVEMTPGLGPERGVMIQVIEADNTLLVTGTDDQIRAAKDVLRLLDVLPVAVEVKAEAVLSLVGSSGRRHTAVLTCTGRTAPGQSVVLKTAVAQPAQQDDITVPSGKFEIGVTPTLHGDNSISMEAKGGVQLEYALPGQAAPVPLSQAADGQVRAPDRATTLLASAATKLGSSETSPATVEVAIFLTPRTIRDAPRGAWSPPDGIRALIVADLGGSGKDPKRAAAARDEVAKALAECARFEVLKPEEADKQAQALGLRRPYAWPALAQIAWGLGATGVVTGEVGGRPGSAAISVTMRDVASGDLLGRATASAGGPGHGDDAASLATAAQMVAQGLGQSRLAEAAVLLANGRTALLNGGVQAGLRRGMQLAVMRDGVRAARLKVTTIGPSTADAVILDNKAGLQPGDTARELLPDREHPGPTPRPVVP